MGNYCADIPVTDSDCDVLASFSACRKLAGLLILRWKIGAKMKQLYSKRISFKLWTALGLAASLLILPFAVAFALGADAPSPPVVPLVQWLPKK